MQNRQAPNPPTRSASPAALACDLLVVGSGAGGLATAVTAARLGLDVIVVEKDARIGGTSAWSGGWMWIPGNPFARAQGVDDAQACRTYLRYELGALYDEDMVETYLAQGPRMVEFFRRATCLEFINGPSIPDFHGNSPGAALGQRAICAAPFDGRELGDAMALLKPPLDLISPFGMGVATLEFAHFVNFLRNRRSTLHVLRRVLRHWADRVRHGQGMYLVNGNALVARLLKSALDAGVRLLPSAPAQSLLLEDGAAVGARLLVSGEPVEIRARRGVVLAAGGFPFDAARRARMFPHTPTGREHWSAAPATNSGDGLRLGESAGGRVRTDGKAPAGWAPVSLVPRPDGSCAHFPHLGMDRAKPGVIMVRPDGQRFCNEADSYHDVVSALFAATAPGETPQAWMVCDHAALRRWGLGRVRPAPFPVGTWLRNGYLKKGRSIAELAGQCGIPPASLERTIARFNEAVRSGRDADFQRGEVAFNRGYGDPGQKPNPCLGPLQTGPFYAIRIVPGSLSTFAGLITDPSARVLDDRGEPVRGLYAVGNDMASIGRGNYPTGGFTLGPAMTFGFIAAHHACGIPLAGRAQQRDAEPAPEYVP